MIKKSADYTNKQVIITFPFFGSSIVLDFLKSLAIAGKLTYDNFHNEKTLFRPSNRIVKFTYSHDQESFVKQFTSFLNKMFKEDFISYEIKETPAFKDDFELLSYLLKTMDWTYWASDDRRVYMSGESQLTHIKTLAKELQKENAEKVIAILKSADKSELSLGIGA